MTAHPAVPSLTRGAVLRGKHAFKRTEVTTTTTKTLHGGKPFKKGWALR